MKNSVALTPLETKLIKGINALLSQYRENKEDCDNSEKTIYCVIINDLQELLSEVIHS